jgi:hypothetical protein
MTCGRRIGLGVLLVLVTGGLLATLGGVAWAAFSSTTSDSQTLATLQLGNATGATASSTSSNTTTCLTTSISWSADPAADAYRVQYREGGGAWIDLVTETGNVTTVSDSLGHTDTTVAYRVYSRDAGSDWEGTTPAVSNSLTCGVSTVSDLAAANPCSSTTLTWTAPAGASSYDVQRRVNSGSWVTLATNQAGTGYTDATIHPAGALVEYQVRAGIGTTTDGAWSAIASIGSWQSFHVTSIVAANSGTLGTLNAGDTVTVTFSKPVTTSSISVNSMTLVKNGGTAGMYLGSAAANTTGIGRLATAAGEFGSSVTEAGTPSWSGGNTVWTWTSTGAGSTMTAALANETFTAGTGPKCAADASSLNGSVQPTASGRW